MALIVPRPTLSQNGSASSVLASDKPIQLACGPVTFPDGTALTIASVTQSGFGFLLYRAVAGGAGEVWDESARAWLPESSAPGYQLLFYKDDKWQSVLVAVGQKDRAGSDKFGAGYAYSVRCFFRGKDAQGVEHAGESARSQAVQIVSSEEQNRAGLAIAPRSLPTAATELRLFLKDDGLVERGQIIIRRAGGGFQIELLASGARLALETSGDIVLTPAPGRDVRVTQGRLFVNSREV